MINTLVPEQNGQQTFSNDKQGRLTVDFVSSTPSKISIQLCEVRSLGILEEAVRLAGIWDW